MILVFFLCTACQWGLRWYFEKYERIARNVVIDVNLVDFYVNERRSLDEDVQKRQFDNSVSRNVLS